MSSRFDDLFSRPSLLHQQTLPQKQQQSSLFDEPHFSLSRNSPSRDTFTKERSSSTTQPPSLASLVSNSSGATNGRQSPVVRTESPKPFATTTSGASVYQIPIQHIQTANTPVNIPSSSNTSNTNNNLNSEIPTCKLFFLFSNYLFVCFLVHMV